MTIWSLARWSKLRDGTWRVADGRLLWACGSCRQDMFAVSASAAVLSCSNVACCLFERPQATLLPKIAYTPLSTAFRRLRLRLGGPRGYPLLGDIPFVIQAPVMHCAGKIRKCLMYFFLRSFTSPSSLPRAKLSTPCSAFQPPCDIPAGVRAAGRDDGGAARFNRL